MDYRPPGSSVQRSFQARILEWVAIPFSRGLNLALQDYRQILYEYSLKGLMLKLKLQYFDHMMQRVNSDARKV